MARETIIMSYRYDNILDKEYNKMTDNKIAVKHDTGKLDMALLPLEGIADIVLALQFGKEKYGRYNYKSGMKYTRVASALLRHIFKWLAGEEFDDESGINHLGHAGACIIMLLDWVTNKRGEDDRYHGNKK